MDADRHAIERIQRGDDSGLTALMERHREPLYRLIFRFVHNEADAAELTEATFFKVYQNAGRYRPKAKVSTWMFSIAGNLCRDALRRNRKRRSDRSLDAPVEHSESLHHGDSLASDAPTPEAQATSNETLRTVEQAIHALPHKLKFPFIFCILEAHSYDACAEALGTNRKTVETRIYRARKRLREDLADLYEDI